MGALWCPEGVDEKDWERDVFLALELLNGSTQLDDRGKYRRLFLSADTEPTENEARAALRRVLDGLQQLTGHCILGRLGELFDPQKSDHPIPRKLLFQKLDQGHSDPARDAEISFWVECKLYDSPDDMDNGKRNKTGLMDAYKAVAKETGLSPKQVRRIYKKPV
jgi:hypothetical protein